MVRKNGNVNWEVEILKIDRNVQWEIGQRIQEARLQKGIKAIDLALALGIGKDQYSRIENGRAICSTDKLYQISQYLEISIDYLLFGDKTSDMLLQINSILTAKSEKEVDRARRVLEAMFS